MTCRPTAIVAATRINSRRTLCSVKYAPQRLEELEAQQNQEHTAKGPLTRSLEVGHRSDVSKSGRGLRDEEPGQFQKNQTDHEDEQNLGERDRKSLEPLGQDLQRRAARGGCSCRWHISHWRQIIASQPNAEPSAFM